MVKHRSPKPRFRVRLAAGPPISMQGAQQKNRLVTAFLLFFCFLMLRALHAPIAKLLELNFALNLLLVFFAHVICPLAGRTVELYKTVL